MKKSIRTVLLVFFGAVFLFSLWKLWGILTGYREGQDSYEALEQYVSMAETKPHTDETLPSPTDPAETAPDVSAWPQVDFEQLAQINPDIIGWIYIPDTNINYPVVQGPDNDYYLDRLFDGTKNRAGSIFLDAWCDPDFSDLHTIIYGHHLKDKTMFSRLMRYKKQSFYDAHPVGLLVTPTAYYKLQFFSGYVSKASGNAWELRFDEIEFADWLEDIRQKSCFTTTYAPTEEDRIVTLSTCTYEFDNARFVLHGYICEEIEKTEP